MPPPNTKHQTPNAKGKHQKGKELPFSLHFICKTVGDHFFSTFYHPEFHHLFPKLPWRRFFSPWLLLQPPPIASAAWHKVAESEPQVDEQRETWKTPTPCPNFSLPKSTSLQCCCPCHFLFSLCKLVIEKKAQQKLLHVVQ